MKSNNIYTSGYESKLPAHVVDINYRYQYQTDAKLSD